MKSITFANHIWYSGTAWAQCLRFRPQNNFFCGLYTFCIKSSPSCNEESLLVTLALIRFYYLLPGSPGQSFYFSRAVPGSHFVLPGQSRTVPGSV